MILIMNALIIQYKNEKEKIYSVRIINRPTNKNVFKQLFIATIFTMT